MINESFNYKIRLYYHYEIVLNYKKYSIGNNLPINFLIHLTISDIDQINMITIFYHYYTYLSYIELESNNEQ